MFQDVEKQKTAQSKNLQPGVLCKICNYVWKRTIYYHINDSETIHSESSQALIDPQGKLNHKTEAFQDYYKLTFPEFHFKIGQG